MTLKKTIQSFQATLPSLKRTATRFGPHIRNQLPLIIGAMVALIIEIGLRLLEPWPLKFVVDYVLVPAAGNTATGIAWLDALGPGQRIGLAAVAVLLIAGGRAAMAYIATIGFALAGNRVLTEVRGDLYRHITRLSLSYHTKARSGDLLTRLTGDIGRLQEVTVTAMMPLLVNVLTLVGMLAVMLWINWQLALIAISIVPAFIFIMTSLGGRIRSVAREERKREGMLAASAAEVIGAIKVVQALSLERTLEGSFAKANQKSLAEGVRGRRLSAGLERGVDALVALSSALVLWYGARTVLGGDMLLGDLLVFTAYLKNAFKPMRDLAKYAGRIAKAAASGERVVEVLDTMPEVCDLPGAAPAPRLRGAVEFHGVGFAYEAGQPILHNLHLSVPAGTRVALVGPSGGGKSTLASLLLRLYDPTSGRISIDGYDTRRFTLASLRRQVAIVPQDSVLFAASIRDNIAFGAPLATPREIVAAATLANAHGFISRLPEGYATAVGERGATLSGGQRQRIAIARAAIRRAPIVILDEPTTGLDQESEQIVTEALERLTAECTTFLIAHDLSTVERADLIVFIEQGRIQEQGTHAELLRLNGRYAAFYHAQTGTEAGRASAEPEVIDALA